MDTRWWLWLWLGVMALVVGLHAIVTRKIAFGRGLEGPHLWLYGWRAVAFGIAAVLVAVAMFAQAAGLLAFPSFTS